MTISRALLEDAEEILELQKLAYQSEAALYGNYDIPPLTQTVDDIRSQFKTHIFLKAVADGSIVGSVRAFENEGTCYIERLAVRPESQNQGIGGALMRAIEACYTPDRFELFTGSKSEKNIYLYKKLGYAVCRSDNYGCGDIQIYYLEKKCDRTEWGSDDVGRLRHQLAVSERARVEEVAALTASLKKLEQLFFERTAELEQKNANLITEISERKHFEDALRESEERLRRMVNAVTGYTYSVEVRDGQAVETTHSMGCVPVTGYMPDDYSVNTYLWNEMIHEDDRQMVHKTVKKLLAGQDVPSIEHRLVRRDGKVVWVKNTMVPHKNESGQVIRYDGLIEDIAKRKSIEEELRAASIIDELTGLHNRRGFMALAQQQLKIASRIKRPLLFFFIDLDGMKWINDNCGHAEGDAALARTAAVLKASFRESDIISRMGGDEFAVLAFESDRDSGSAELLNSRIQCNVDAENLRGPSQYTLSLSIGTARFEPGSGATVEDLLAKADSLMYDEKQRKKSRQPQHPQDSTQDYSAE